MQDNQIPTDLIPDSIWTHVWYWRPRLGERFRKGKRCRVLLRAKRNSILVEMEDGELVVGSRYAVRRVGA